MALGNLSEFNIKKKLGEDFCESMEFFCVANNIHGDNADRKKAIFIVLWGKNFY